MLTCSIDRPRRRTRPTLVLTILITAALGAIAWRTRAEPRSAHGCQRGELAFAISELRAGRDAP